MMAGVRGRNEVGRQSESVGIVNKAVAFDGARHRQAGDVSWLAASPGLPTWSGPVLVALALSPPGARRSVVAPIAVVVQRAAGWGAAVRVVA